MYDDTKKKSAIFLDRDGVINEVLTERVKFVNTTSDLYIIPGAAKAIGIFNKLGYTVYIVTNQAGVAYGYMKQETLDEIHKELQIQLLAEDEAAVIHEVAACTHLPANNCACRKPNAGLITNIAEKYNVDLGSSYMIGDMETDVAAGKKAETKTILISSSNEETAADAKYHTLLAAAQSISTSIN